MTNPVGRLALWSTSLQRFDFKVVYRSGKVHSNADALSLPIMALTTRDSEMSDDGDNISSSELDPYEDAFLLH